VAETFSCAAESIADLPHSQSLSLSLSQLINAQNLRIYFCCCCFTMVLL
jgi:hypothetical protein